MADITASTIERTPNWRLLAEFVIRKDPLSEPSIRGPVSKAIRGLEIQPEQLERICEVIMRALYRSTHGVQQADNRLTVRMRIWSSAADAGKGGWGFFLVEKPGRAAGQPSSETTYVVDLFLYREQSS